MDYYIELLNSLKRGVIAPVYLFYGEETYLREQAVARFKEYFFPGRDQDLNFDLIDGEDAGPEDIVARAETLPFFAAKRLVVVKNPSFFKSAKKAGKEEIEDGEETAGPVKETALLEYFDNPAGATCLIFTTGDPVDKRKRLFKAVQKNGRAVEFTCLNRSDLSRWLAQRARAAGRKFAPGAAETLLDTVGPSLQKLAAEMEKLVNFTAGQEVITPAEVRKVCPPGLEESIFAVVDAVGNKKAGEALAAIRELLAAKEPPFRLLAMIIRQFRLLLQVKDLLGRGCPAGQIPARLKIHPYVARKTAVQCRNFSRESLLEAFQLLLELDESVKTGRQEFYPALEIFLLKLCAGS